MRLTIEWGTPPSGSDDGFAAGTGGLFTLAAEPVGQDDGAADGYGFEQSTKPLSPSSRPALIDPALSRAAEG